jgi:membrane fusion protein, multidrug efflux system
MVTSGLTTGERIVVNGLQRVRPGTAVSPQIVRMELRDGAEVQASAPADVAQR